MRSSFPGYYRPSDEEFEKLWRDCIFVLDANVLLNLYRYPEKARDELLEVLTGLKGRLWVPFQAALEYQRNRPIVIADQKKRFREVKDATLSMLSKLEGEFGKLQVRDRHSIIDPDPFLAKLRPIVDEFSGELNSLEAKHPNVHDADSLRERLDELLLGAIGEAPTEKFIQDTIKEGLARFAAKMPPGFRDDKKGENDASLYSYGGVNYEGKYGDLILWKQILSFAKAKPSSSIVLLTDDEKPDWWWVIDAEGKKRLGPRPELIEEAKRVGEVEAFYMYGSVQFLSHAKSFLKAEVSQESIDQVRDVAQRSSTRNDELVQYFQAAEEAVGSWIQEENPGRLFLQNRHSWPDFELGGDAEESPIGFDVMAVRSPAVMSIANRVRDRLYRAYHAIQEGRFSNFELVVVLPEIQMVEHTLARLSRTVDLPKGVGVILGIVDGSSHDPIFCPIDRFSAGN